MEPLEVGGPDRMASNYSTGSSSAVQKAASWATGMTFNRTSVMMSDILKVSRKATGDFGEIPVESHLEGSYYSIFARDVEEVIEAERPEVKTWLQSAGGMVVQAGICLVFIALYCYEVIFKKMTVEAQKAGTVQKADNMSFIFAMGLVSIAIGIVLSAFFRTFHYFTDGGAIKQLIAFTPCGCIVATTNLLTFIIIEMIDADTFKIILQLRLIGVAVVARFALGTRQSTTAWFCLFLTLLGAVAFSQAKDVSLESANFRGLLGNQATFLSNSKFANMPELLASGTDDADSHATFVSLLNAAASHSPNPKANTLATLIDSNTAEKSGANSLGYLLTIGYVLADSCNAVYEQKVLQGGGDTPFYVQMTFKLIPYTVMALVLKLVLGPHIAKDGDVSIFKEGFFSGWGNAPALLTFFSLIGKEWFQGIVIKQLSSMVRQLCGVVSVALLYFLLKLHGVDQAPLSFPVILIDLSVMFSVLAYANAQMSFKEQQILQEKVEALETTPKTIKY